MGESFFLILQDALCKVSEPLWCFTNSHPFSLSQGCDVFQGDALLYTYTPFVIGGSVSVYVKLDPIFELGLNVLEFVKFKTRTKGIRNRKNWAQTYIWKTSKNKFNVKIEIEVLLQIKEQANPSLHNIGTNQCWFHQFFLVKRTSNPSLDILYSFRSSLNASLSSIL